MLKPLLLFTCCLCLFKLNAQKNNNSEILVETGIHPFSRDSENLGLFLHLEPKVKAKEDLYFGLRFGVIINAFVFENNDVFAYQIDEVSDNGFFSFVLTFDRYWQLDHRRLYLGTGLGYYIAPTAIDIRPSVSINPEQEIIDGTVNNRPGLLIRGGVESGRLRAGLEYNFLPKGEISIPDGQIIGTVKSSYFGLSVGFIIGGGKEYFGARQ